MKLDILDVDEFISINELKPVTSPIIFQRGGIPDIDGLLSTSIFGSTVSERKETYGYIDLAGNFLHPSVYKALRSVFRGIDDIISGTSFYIMDKSGNLTKDDSGETGIDFIYNNWKKINWGEREEGSGKIRNERLDLVYNTPKDLAFVNKWPVLPPFYRDITSDAGGGGSTSELNSLYTKLIRHSDSLRNKGMFDFAFHTTNKFIQDTLEEIYVYFESKIEKKNGLIRKYLMGKTVINSVRAVITATPYHSNTPDEEMVNFRYSGIPIAQLCGLVYPFLINACLNWVRVNIIANQNLINIDNNNLVADKPDSYFTDKYFEKMISNFMKNPESRFDEIRVPVKDLSDNTTKTIPIKFTGYRTGEDNLSEEDIRRNYRNMTILDLLFILLNDIIKDKYCLCTRYPILDQFSIFCTKMRILTINNTVSVTYNDIEYKYYPNIDLNTPKSEIGLQFIDSMRFSMAYLKGLDGDYDGDQCTVKVLWTQEANNEAAKMIKKKSYILGASGKTIRSLGSAEPLQSFYAMTKDPTDESKPLSKENKEWLLSLSSNDFTLKLFTQMFGNFRDPSKKENSNIPQLKPFDTFTLPAPISPTGKDLNTTVGRYIISLLFLKHTGCDKVLPYINYPLTDDNMGGVESILSKGLLHDKISVDNMIKFIDIRDWSGMVLHGLITYSFSPNTIKIHPEVRKLRTELLKKYSKELANGDAKISALIEDELVSKTKEVLKGDKGLDLYLSGVRGSISNNMKNNWMYRGATKNVVTGNWDIITTSLDDGVDKKDIPAGANTILNGAYAKSVQTAVTGYLGKQLMAALQTESLDVKGSDCKSKRTIPVFINKDNKKELLYRYIVENGKLKYLDDDNIDSYLGKFIHLRSPMCCTSKRICNICAGNLYYDVDIEHAGLMAVKISTALTRMSMKKFHDASVKTIKIDPNDLMD